MNTLIAQSKFGNCSRCSATNTQCKKRGKDLVCLRCCSTEDVLKQMDKAKRKHALIGDTKKVKALGLTQDKDIAKRSALIADIDMCMSIYIRLKDANKEGMVKCFCCPTILHWKEAHNSHYIRRGHMGLRFLVDNCRPSCPKCNNKHNDNVEPYRSLLEADKPGVIEFLEERARLVHKYTQDELKELLIDFRFKAQMVKSKLINQ